MPEADPFAWAVRIGAILDSLGIHYVVGGSVASMLYGERRSTNDLDVVVDVDEPSVLALVERLKPAFYVEEEDAIEAVRHRSSFNAIDYATMMKIDFFIADHRDAVRTQLDRGRRVELHTGAARFYTAEDILVQKLVWFRMGGEQSELQWRDILGVLRISQPRLDNAYLDRAAAAFEVADLLVRARIDAAP